MTDSLHLLGKFTKTHGFGGALILVSDNPLDDALENLTEVFVIIDGLSVPFFVQELILRAGSSAQLKLEFVDTSEEAVKLTGCEVYAAIVLSEPEAGLEQWEGYTVHDSRHGEIGIIRQIEDYKGNIVLQVMKGEAEILISLFPELVTGIDNNTHTLFITAPEGYFE